MAASLRVPLRSPDHVMRLARMGASHPTRLSFARVVLRRIETEGWRVSRSVWAIDRDGFGHAVYRVDTGRRVFSLIAFSRDLPPEKRTDRVIADAWDTSYVLYDGMPDEAAIARLETEVPLQEAGRFTETELILSRANKSVRLFENVVSCLAEGRQPGVDALDAVGYLMRTTAVYGNGKFGIADRDAYAQTAELAGPFRAEMLTVWLIRAFTVDLADHCAEAKAPGRAVRLAPELRRRLGVGNSTGLGMAPFLVRHPTLLHRWILARETALARVRSLEVINAGAWRQFMGALHRMRGELADWRTADEVQAGRIAELDSDFTRLAAEIKAAALGRSWDEIFLWAEAHLRPEAQELVASLIIEPHGVIVDDLAETMDADERDAYALDGVMSCGAVRALIEADYAWALSLDHAADASHARFWYVSAEKLEPRLGERHAEEGAALEQPLAFGRDVAALHRLLVDWHEAAPCAECMLAHPETRHIIRRVQIAARYPYAEIRDNLIDAAMRPIDLLRCKLAFFGATRFDPRSDRWLRISLFQGAPFPEDFAARDEGRGAAA